jgi:RND family efflux transporter MFP subunit
MKRSFKTCLLLLVAVSLPLVTTSLAMAQQRSYPGTVFANRTVNLAFRVGGPLVKVLKDAGDLAKKGELLMQIDPRDFADQIVVLEAQLAGAKAQKQRAEKDFSRATTLFDQQVSASADFDLAKSVFDATEAGVKTLEAQLRIARHRLQDCSLKAPFDGIVTARQVENFEMVQPGQVVLTMHDISPLEVEIKIPENEMVNLKLEHGESAQVRLISVPGQSFEATLKEWQTVADPLTRTYLLRFSFSVPDGLQALPGMTAEVQL